MSLREAKSEEELDCMKEFQTVIAKILLTRISAISICQLQKVTDLKTLIPRSQTESYHSFLTASMYCSTHVHNKIRAEVF